MARFLEIKEEKITILKHNNFYELNRNVDFSKPPYNNVKEAFLIEEKDSRKVIERFVLEEGISELASRIENKINKEFTIYTLLDKKGEESLSSLKRKFLEITGTMFGYKEIKEEKYVVIKTYDNLEDFKKEDNEENIMYGMYSIISNKIENIFRNPKSVLVCYDDFGKQELSYGSVLVKLEEI